MGYRCLGCCKDAANLQEKERELPVLIFFRLGFFTTLVVISVLALVPLEDSSFTTGWDKLNHVLAFGVLLLLLDSAYPLLRLWQLKIPVLLFYALLIEFIQAFIPYREFSLLDIVADVVGLGVYLLLRSRLLHWQRIFYR